MKHDNPEFLNCTELPAAMIMENFTDSPAEFPEPQIFTINLDSSEQNSPYGYGVHEFIIPPILTDLNPPLIASL